MTDDDQIERELIRLEHSDAQVRIMEVLDNEEYELGLSPEDVRNNLDMVLEYVRVRARPPVSVEPSIN